METCRSKRYTLSLHMYHSQQHKSFDGWINNKYQDQNQMAAHSIFPLEHHSHVLQARLTILLNHHAS